MRRDEVKVAREWRTGETNYEHVEWRIRGTIDGKSDVN